MALLLSFEVFSLSNLHAIPKNDNSKKDFDIFSKEFKNNANARILVFS